MIALILKRRWLYLIVVILVHGTVAPSSLSQVSTSPVNRWSDSCVSSSFVGTINVINSQYSFSGFSQVHDYTNDDVIAIGSIRPNLPPTNLYKVYGLIMRISKTGIVKWTKFVGIRDSPYDSDTRFNVSVVTKNREIVVVGSTAIFRFDGDGNVVWQQKTPYFSSSHVYQQIIETSDGGLLLCGPSFSNGVVAKLHSTGILDWARHFALDAYLNCRSMIETPSGYYFTGYSYSGFDPYQQNVLVKINKLNGDTLWCKSFGKATNAEFAYDWMEYIQGRLVLTGNTSVNYIGANKSSQSIVTFDEAGTFIDHKKIVNQDIPVQKTSLFRSRLFDPVSKTGVQYSDQLNNDIYLYRLDDQFKPLWAWKFPMFNREEIEDMQILPDSSAVLAGKTVTHVPGFIERALLIKTTKSGMLSDCINEPGNITVTSPPIAVTTVRIGTGPASSLGSSALLQVFDGTGFTWQLLCEKEATCRLGKIQGDDAICVGSPNTYKIQRDGSCRNPVVYTSSDSSISLRVVSDSSIAITAAVGGRFVLYASTQVSCGILRDSMVIHASGTLTTLNIGADTSICPATRISLNAKSGYTSYRWQDNSTDSIFHVTVPGLYHVSVTDGCGRDFKDSINVSLDLPAPINIGPDRAKCNSDTIHLSAPVGFLTYLWSSDYSTNVSNTQLAVVNPLVNTHYFIKAERKPGCFVHDTVAVTVRNSPPINLGPDTAFCAGATAVLDAGGGFDSYKWSTGTVTQKITVNAAGKYSIVAQYSNGCFSVDTFVVNQVYALPPANLGTDTTLCLNGHRTLQVTAGYKRYLWQDASTNSSYTVSGLGRYWVEVEDAKGCTGRDTITINKFVQGPANFLPDDLAICSNETYALRAVNNFQSYLWSNNATSAQTDIDRPGTYWLEVLDKNNCRGRDTIVISLKKCFEGFSIPTSFTPNKDGKNDSFKPILHGDIKQYQFVVVNRWGQTIFQTNNHKIGWDGLVKGREQSTGNFVWYCRYKLAGQEEKIEKGSVLLLR